MFSLLSNKYVIIGFLVVSVLCGAYIYHIRTTAQIERLSHANELLKIENTSLVQAKARLEQETKQIIETHKAVAQKAEDLAVEANKKYETLYRENEKKKSLEQLAIKKTSLIEKKINKATAKQFTCFENISKGIKCE